MAIADLSSRKAGHALELLASLTSGSPEAPIAMLPGNLSDSLRAYLDVNPDLSMTARVELQRLVLAFESDDEVAWRVGSALSMLTTSQTPAPRALFSALAYNRGGSAASYTLLIDGNPVPLAGAEGDQSFRNILSAGDRNTLALAFFFASLQHDPARAEKVVVIDDPMTSLDEHRTLHTLQEMDRLARDATSMIVLSHSKPFLLGVWDKCQQLPKAAMEVRRAAVGSTLAAWDVNAAMITEHDRRYADVVAYLNQADPAMERRVAEALRPMLEAFARVAYPADFPPGTLLGPFHAACVQRHGGPREVMGAASAQELRAILDFANRYHHDTNAAYATELINDAELSDFACRTLAFIRHP